MEAAAGMLKAVRLGLSFDPTIVQWWCLCHFPLCMKKGDKTRTSFFWGGRLQWFKCQPDTQVPAYSGQWANLYSSVGLWYSSEASGTQGVVSIPCR